MANLAIKPNCDRANKHGYFVEFQVENEYLSLAADNIEKARKINGITSVELIGDKFQIRGQFQKYIRKAKNLLEYVKEIIHVPKLLAGHIIGKKGNKFNFIMTKYDIIEIIEEEKDENENLPFVFVGTLNAINKTKKFLSDHLEQMKSKEYFKEEEELEAFVFLQNQLLIQTKSLHFKSEYFEEFTVQTNLLELCSIGIQGHEFQEAKKLKGIISIDLEECTGTFKIVGKSQDFVSKAVKMLNYVEGTALMPRHLVGIVYKRGGKIIDEIIAQSGVVQVKIEDIFPNPYSNDEVAFKFIGKPDLVFDAFALFEKQIKYFKTIEEEHNLEMLLKYITQILKGDKEVISFRLLKLNAQNLVGCGYGYKIYMEFKNIMSAHLEEKISPDPPNFLQSINTVWNDLQSSLVTIQDILREVDYSYVKKNGTRTIYQLGMFLFEQHIRSKLISFHLQSTLLLMVTLERRGEVVDRPIIKCICQLLIDLGQGSRSLYEEIFEGPFLQQSTEYYQNEFKNFLEESKDAAKIQAKLSDLILKEEDLIKHCLHESTEERVAKIFEEVLLDKSLKFDAEKRISNNATSESTANSKFITKLKDAYKFIDDHKHLISFACTIASFIIKRS